MNDFYIERLPSHCDYIAPPLFFLNPPEGPYPLGNQLQIVDDRWTAERIEQIVNSPLPHGYSGFFEVTDIESSVDGSENWVCGFSLYFLKECMRHDQLRRIEPSNHEKLVDGVQVLVDYRERSPETVLRFYVSPEAWEAIAARGLMGREHTQFYKMAHGSEDSQIGTMWRLLALDDTDYEYAIQTDVAPDEPWILARTTQWGQREFLERLSPDRFFFSGETYFEVYSEFDRELRSDIESVRWQITDGYAYPNLNLLQIFDHITPGGITTIPQKIPRLVPLFCEYFSQSGILIVFNCETDQWTKFEQDDPIFFGWKGLGPDQNFWRFLKRAIPMRHIIDPLWGVRLRDYPQDHYVFRMVRQYEKSGHAFVMDKTWQPLLDYLEMR